MRFSSCRPVRRYFQYLLSRTEEEDVKTGRCGNELSSIRIDRSYPSERTSDSASTPQSFKCGQLAEQLYQTPGELTKAFLQPLNCNVLLVQIITNLCLMFEWLF